MVWKVKSCTGLSVYIVSFAAAPFYDAKENRCSG